MVSKEIELTIWRSPDGYNKYHVTSDEALKAEGYGNTKRSAVRSWRRSYRNEYPQGEYVLYFKTVRVDNDPV